MKKFSFRITGNNLSRREEAQTLLLSFLVAFVVFVGFPVYYTLADSGNANISISVSQTMTFSVSTDNYSGNLTPGVAMYATTTLSMLTTNATGYNVTLYCQNETTNNCLTHSDTVTQIPNKSQWSIPGAAATTTAGNSSLITGGDAYFAFRGMTASSTHYLFPTTWWGTVDAYPGAGTTLWAGVASTTNVSRVGNTSWYNASTDLNSIQYYVNVAGGQKGGLYSATLVYTGTANP
jgi:hypothetical protein